MVAAVGMELVTAVTRLVVVAAAVIGVATKATAAALRMQVAVAVVEKVATVA